MSRSNKEEEAAGRRNDVRNMQHGWNRREAREGDHTSLQEAEKKKQLFSSKINFLLLDAETTL